MHSPPTEAGQAGATRFFSAVERRLPDAFGGLPYWLARFEPALFSADLFAAFRMPLPARLQGSLARRQAEFLAGRLCARQALAPFGLGDIAVGIGAAHEPLWPPGYLGSITHDARHAAALACPAQAHGGVGIDIETVVDAAGRPAMLDLVVDGAEAQLLRAHGGLPFDTLLTLAFSAKESFYKAAYRLVGAYFDYDAVRVVGIDDARAVLRLRCALALAPGLPQGFLCDAHVEAVDAATWLSAVVLPRPAAA